MATVNIGPFLPATVGAASLVGKEGYALKRSSAGAVLADATATQAVIGVCTDGSSGAGIGGQTSYQEIGQGRVITGAAVAAGASLAVNATGKYITATTGQKIVAVAITAAAATDLFISADLGFYGIA